jgi:muramoyltetrapeptide carboxypeptidase
MSSSDPAAKPVPIPLRPLPSKGTIGIFAPSSPVEAEKLERGVRYLESLGYRVELAAGCYRADAYIAGNGKERAADFMSLVERDDIDAVFCTRGGFGSIMMLPHLDYQVIRQKRKILLGFSDVTALQWGIFAKTGLPSISAGMAGTDLSYETRNPEFESQFWQLLDSGEINIKLPEQSIQGIPSPYHKKQVEGIMMPGTLSVAAMLLGTSYFPDLSGCIPVLEDVNEQRHKLEAYLQQLRIGGHFDNIEAVIRGYISPAAEEEYPELPSLDEIFNRAFTGLNREIPQLSGLSYGHIPNKISLPVGIPISLSLTAEPVLETRQRIFDS